MYVFPVLLRPAIIVRSPNSSSASFTGPMLLEPKLRRFQFGFVGYSGVLFAVSMVMPLMMDAKIFRNLSGYRITAVG